MHIMPDGNTAWNRIEILSILKFKNFSKDLKAIDLISSGLKIGFRHAICNLRGLANKHIAGLSNYKSHRTPILRPDEIKSIADLKTMRCIRIKTIKLKRIPLLMINHILGWNA